MKSKISTILLIFVFILGLSLVLYPSLSDYWNTLHASRSVSKYVQEVSNLDKEEYNEILLQAIKYNFELPNRNNSFALSEKQKEEYENLLNVGGNGIMGYIEIPDIDVELPIYHGVEERVMQVAAGHLEWSSLPVGGESAHCVISGHRGLPSAKLFTNLDKLTEGDTFYIKVLDETLTYRVDRILIVEPKETKDLLIENGKDYCTLVTCTPYGINTHRLLVRGERVKNNELTGEARVTADAYRIETLIVAPILAVIFFAVTIPLILIRDRINKLKYKKNLKNKEIC